MNVTIVSSGRRITLQAEKGTLLSELLIGNGFSVEHPCGGKGICRKCTVRVNGRDELSCRYIIESDITAELPGRSGIHSLSMEEGGSAQGELCLALDIGTTTLAMALFSRGSSSAVKTAASDNPQRVFGADVMSRILRCSENGPYEQQKLITDRVSQMADGLLKKYGLTKTDTMYVAGNTAMLHLFTGTDCSSMGTYPYEPSFIDGRSFTGKELNIPRAGKIITLPCVSSFVGADIVSGLSFCGRPDEGKYRLFIDLGTNAETVLYSREKYLCTSAAAGPCFEGAGISCGMSAVDGAICSCRADGSYSVIGDALPDGLCATGLIDIIAVLLDKGICDETGALAGGDFEICEGISITQRDVRQFQNAKSAVFSAISSLIKAAGIGFDDIDAFCVAGGFSSAMNIDSAIRTGLFPGELREKFIPVNNSCLKGLVGFAGGQCSLEGITEKAEYIDLSSESGFAEMFIDNMPFE